MAGFRSRDEGVPLPDFLLFEGWPQNPPRVLSLRETEQFLLLAAYLLWRRDISPIDGEQLDKLRGALSPHPVREQNKQFGLNVMEVAVERLTRAGLIELGCRGLTPSLKAVDELERAMAETGKDPERVLRRILEA
jgi:hypothetical protein